MGSNFSTMVRLLNNLTKASLITKALPWKLKHEQIFCNIKWAPQPLPTELIIINFSTYSSMRDLNKPLVFWLNFMRIISHQEVTEVSAKDYPVYLKIATVVKGFCPLHLRIFFQPQGLSYCTIFVAHCKDRTCLCKEA